MIGHPIDHSLSPKMHNAAFVVEARDYVYLPMDVSSEDLAVAVSGLRALGFRSFNVTMPHKQTILPLLDNIDEVARVSGAVNTVLVENYELYGFNTDGTGFVEACKESKVEFADRRVLVLGAGGAASAIAVALCGEGTRELQIIDQSTERAEELRSKLHELDTKTRVEAYTVKTLDETALETDVIINATPLGMRKEDPLPVPPGYLERDKAVCDAVYLRPRLPSSDKLANEALASFLVGGCCCTREFRRKESGPDKSRT